MSIDVFARSALPLWEAAAFTCGCALLRKQRFDDGRVGMILVVIAASLALVLLIMLTPENLRIDPDTFDSGYVWSRRLQSRAWTVKEASLPCRPEPLWRRPTRGAVRI